MAPINKITSIDIEFNLNWIIKNPALHLENGDKPGD